MEKTLRFTSYDRWYNANYEWLEQQYAENEDTVTVSCDACKGSGTWECEHCGAEHECTECLGDGKVEASDFDEFARAMYEEQLEADRLFMTEVRRKQLGLSRGELP